MDRSVRKVLLFFVCIVLLSSCSSDGDSAPTITTLPAAVQVGTVVTLSYKISGNPGTILARGICWSTTDNPVKGVDNFIEENVDQVGTFTYQILTLSPNTMYYARSYFDVGNGIQYGNTISFTTGQFVATDKAIDIWTTKATLTGQKTFSGDGIVGFVYSTSHNPTIADHKVFQSVTTEGTYQISLDELTPNTTYYFRAYLESSFSDYTYGEEYEFKTCGYFGEAGGYVAYDKGEATDGWRYLEVYPTTLSYNLAVTPGSAWGNSNLFVSGTLDAIGAGPANTNVIVSSVPQANCAAKLCQDLVLNGKSDWFLGSSEEMLRITQSMYDAGTVIGSGSNIWTSTQNDDDYAKAIQIETISSTISVVSVPKTFTNLNVLPLRRY